MLEKFLRDRAILYTCGSLAGSEREQFELILEWDEELRELVSQLQEVEFAVLVHGRGSSTPSASGAVKRRIQSLIASQPQESTADGLVMTGPDGLVRWVNPAFTDLCGYSLEEVRGKKLGPILQGEETDPAAANRLRNAVHGYRPCKETLINYHKNGTPYRVEISFTPIFDDEHRPIYLAARERVVSLD